MNDGHCQWTCKGPVPRWFLITQVAAFSWLEARIFPGPEDSLGGVGDGCQDHQSLLWGKAEVLSCGHKLPQPRA